MNWPKKEQAEPKEKKNIAEWILTYDKKGESRLCRAVRTLMFEIREQDKELATLRAENEKVKKEIEKQKHDPPEHERGAGSSAWLDGDL